jgi:drug/metabolite transporter (DMT)-like permease
MIWILTAVVAGFFNAFWTALSKPILKKIPPRIFTLVFRFLTCLLFLPFALCQWSWPCSLKWWGITLAAGILEGARIWLLTLGVKKDYYSTYAFYNLSPLFMVLAAPLFLGERITGTLVAGGSFITLGAFLFYRMGRWSWPGLVGALFSTLSALLSKSALEVVSPFFFSFWIFGIGALVLVPLESRLQADGGRAGAFRAGTWKKILPIAFWSFVASILFYAALKYAPASKVNPLFRANLLFGFFLSYFMLNEKEHWKEKALGGVIILLGMGLVVLG